MDGLKLDKWRENFNQQVQNLQIEFGGFFNSKKLSEFYEIKEDEVSQSLALVIKDDNLPKEIQDRLTTLFGTTRPEDSV
jgi:hypothetical protein